MISKDTVISSPERSRRSGPDKAGFREASQSAADSGLAAKPALLMRGSVTEVEFKLGSV